MKYKIKIFWGGVDETDLFIAMSMTTLNFYKELLNLKIIIEKV